MKIKNENLYGEPPYDDSLTEDSGLGEVSPQENIVQKFHKEYEYAIDSDKRALYVVGHITEDTLYEIIGGINLIRRQSDGADDKKPINVIIMSNGGDVYPMLGIIDFLRGIDVKVNTIIRGAAMSAAALIAIAATGKRYMSQNSILMLHEFSIEMSQNNTTSLIKNTKHIEYLQEKIYDMIAQFTGKDKDFWKSKLNNDLFLSAQEAKDLGLIDEII